MSCVDRFEFTFELATIKLNGRVYLFAADNAAERQRWVNYLAKVSAERGSAGSTTSPR